MPNPKKSTTENKLKKIAWHIISRLKLLNFTRKATKRYPRIIMYHGFCGESDNDWRNLPASVFKKQLIYLKKHYKLYKLHELIDYKLQTGKYPEYAAVITIDDGYQNFYQWALPALLDFNIPATLFVVSSLTEKREWIWTDKVWYLWDKALISKRERIDLFLKLFRTPVHERNHILDEYQIKLNFRIPKEPPPRYTLMSWNHLKEIADTDLIEIGSHSQKHPILSTLSGENAWVEINSSRIDIERRLGINVKSFCYPNGLPGDFGEEHVEMLAKAGYTCATASHFGFTTEKSSLFRLPRINGAMKEKYKYLKAFDGLDYLRYMKT